MTVTIEQVIADIKSGKSKIIYTCSRSLWWTHLDEDVKDSTDKAHLFIETRDELILQNPNVSEDKKARLRALKAGLVQLRKDNPIAFPDEKTELPLSPIGAQLFQMNDPMKWINQSQMKPDWFGKHGMKAFILTHHKNCKGHFYNKWEKYNDLIDTQK